MALSAGTLSGDPIIAATIVVAAIASFPLALFGILAYKRRRTTAYFFVATALVAFFLQAVLGGLSLVGIFSTRNHQLLEHGLDIAIAFLLIGAVYVARNAKQLDSLPFDDSW